MLSRYVCAFVGRRDYYQLPVALAESGLLEQFIADAYAMPLLRRMLRLLPEHLGAKALSRFDQRIPDDRVSCLWRTFATEHARHKLGFVRALTYAKTDRHYSLAAERVARQARSDLFLYTSYAWEAFTAKYNHTPRKIMFQYHPHPDCVRRILAEDFASHPLLKDSFALSASTGLPESLLRRERDAWRYADCIVCASSFTRQTLIEAGAKPELCRVVPYGIDLPQVTQTVAPQSFQVLFVGSGGQRKGLHHLLEAWGCAALPKGSRLTLVCRSMDPELERRAATCVNVQVLRGVSSGKLGQLFQQSALFAMPSLVEGFGQVYLEALAQGCPVLGTPHTALPDLGSSENGVFVVPIADLSCLVSELERLAVLLPGNRLLRAAARACAARFSWPRFRQQIIATLLNTTASQTPGGSNGRQQSGKS